jgi:hypothetical protein
MIKVIGIKITDRIKEAGLTQDILSNHSSVISTRLGFHEVTDDVCSREAYIILHVSGDPLISEKLADDLKTLEGIEVREIAFTGDDEGANDDNDGNVTEIIGLLVEKDKEVIGKVQKLLTSYGCNIRTRLGVNEVFFGEPAGLIILEMKGENEQRRLLLNKLKELPMVHVRSMAFGK